MKDLTQERANQLFQYKDGILFSKKSGKPVGYKRGVGYLSLWADGKNHYLHRVVYIIHFGLIEQEVDHIDGNKLNNCIENLRQATRSQNNQNVGKNSRCTSGYKGASFHKDTNKWQARIWVNGKRKHLGLYDTVEQASLAYQTAAYQLHKDFANAGEQPCQVTVNY